MSKKCRSTWPLVQFGIAFLFIGVVLCGDRPLSADVGDSTKVFDHARQAYLAAQNLRSCKATGRLQQFAQAVGEGKPRLVAEADVVMCFDKKKYYVNLNYKKRPIDPYYIDRQILIHDGGELYNSRFSKMYHPYHCEAFIWASSSDVNEYFPWDPCFSSRAVIGVEALSKKMPTISILDRSKGLYRGTYDIDKLVHADFDISSQVGYNVTSSRVFNKSNKNPVQQVQVTWKKESDVWFVQKTVEELDLRSKGHALTRNVLEYDKFEINPKVPASFFDLAALELKEGARIIDHRPDAKEGVYDYSRTMNIESLSKSKR